jgi:uncharacterized protein (TIGR02466 family)
MGKRMGLFDKITDGLKNGVDIKRGYTMTKKKTEEMEVVMHQLFPTPVIFTNMNRPFTKKEKDFFKECSRKQRTNTGNTSSEDNNILDHEEMADVKAHIQKFINYYMENVEMAIDGVELRITQSWLNFTKKGQFHHRHAHPNSYISGVLYINADVENDKIFFYRDAWKQLKIHHKDWNPYNSDSWWYSVGSGDITLFPSSTTHMVDQVQTSSERISLAFNTFPIGYLGDDDDLTGLHLQEEMPKEQRKKHEGWEERRKNNRVGY